MLSLDNLRRMEKCVTAKTVNSPNTPKYPRGHHPNTLANLKPAWKPGETGHAGHTGPLITPHLRRYAQMRYPAFQEIDTSKICVAEALALAMLTFAFQPKGEADRRNVLDRLDGALPRNVDVALNPGEGWLTLQQKLRELEGGDGDSEKA